MNCAICLAYLRDKNKCPGCRLIVNDQSKSRVNCIIKNCDFYKKNKSVFCYDCEKYPCKRMKQLDKRYQTKYNMSMIENLGNIKSKGLKQFIKDEQKRWLCKDCGGTICVHRGHCLSCN